MDDNKMQLFENKRIRTIWDEDKQEWLFSIIDVVELLTDSAGPNNYWKVLKSRLIKEGNQLVTNCNQLKMKSHKDGKMYKTDVANTEQLLRIIQSIPSPKVEPLKLWLAKVGSERIDETTDPELAIDRALDTYLKKGYSPEWIHQRLLSIRVRNDLTAEWDARGIQKGLEYAILTDEITNAWSGFTARQYKNYKGLKKENLRDNMSDLELILNMLAESTTTEISRQEKPENFEQNRKIAKRGGSVAGQARKNIETETGKPVVIQRNAVDFAQLLGDAIDEKNNKQEP